MFESPGLRYLYERYIGDDPVRIAEFEKVVLSCNIAYKLRVIREDAGLSQTELAKLVGTAASVISRFENDDYGKHSLAMLHHIATALKKRVVINFEDIK